MTYAELSQEDKDKMDYFTTLVRSFNGEFAQSIHKVQAIKDYYDANSVGPVLASVDAVELVPNKTGLAGAVDMKREDISALVGNLASLLSTYNTQALRLARVQAAGINASL